MFGADATRLDDLRRGSLPPHHYRAPSGTAALINVAKPGSSTGILVLSQYVEQTYASELLAGGEGGVGYLLKDRVSRLADLADALSRVAAGGTVLDPEVVSALLAHRRARDPLSGLSPRERDVPALMVEGRTNIAIGRALVVTGGAVEKHISSIFVKLGLPPSDDDRRVKAVLAWLQP